MFGVIEEKRHNQFSMLSMKSLSDLCLLSLFNFHNDFYCLRSDNSYLSKLIAGFFRIQPNFRGRDKSFLQSEEAAWHFFSNAK